eukprot:scaffold34616_cov159-Skeletonema_dohrnii-CCMP3373.AAC.3
MEHVDIVATEETTFSNHSDANADAHDTTIDDDMIYNVENEDDAGIADAVHDNDGHDQHNSFNEPRTTSAISAPLSAAVVVVAQTARHDVEDIEQQNQVMVGETINASAITVSNNATSFFDSFVFLAQDVEVATEASTCTSLGDCENALQHQEEEQGTTSAQVGFESTLQRLPVATLVATDDDNERQRSLQRRTGTLIMFFLPIVVVAIIAIILSYRS